MKRNLLIGSAVFFLFVLSVNAQTAKNSEDLILEKGVAAHGKIDDIYRRFSDAYRKLDPEMVTNLYTEDAFYLAPGNDVKRGREKILAEFLGFFNSVKSSGGSLTISFQILDRAVSGDLAYDVGIYTVTEKKSDGKTQSGRGKFVVIARQTKTGEWRFHLDSYSSLPNPKNGSTNQ